MSIKGVKGVRLDGKMVFVDCESLEVARAVFADLEGTVNGVSLFEDGPAVRIKAVNKKNARAIQTSLKVLFKMPAGVLKMLVKKHKTGGS